MKDKSPTEKMNPVIPFLQDFLSSVEVLELGNDGEFFSDLIEDMSTIPYVILHNIVTSSQPRLKYPKIHGIPFVKTRYNSSVYEL